jgi:hypothetical protein
MIREMMGENAMTTERCEHGQLVPYCRQCIADLRRRFADAAVADDDELRGYMHKAVEDALKARRADHLASPDKVQACVAQIAAADAAATEELCAAFVSEYGCKPSECEIVRQMFGGGEIRIFVRKRSEAGNGMKVTGAMVDAGLGVMVGASLGVMWGADWTYWRSETRALVRRILEAAIGMKG